MRLDLRLISDWIQPKSHLLDLGCGDGTLLHHLQQQRDVTGYGLEIDPANLESAIAKGVNVLHHDLNEGLSDFDEKEFDVVVMAQALQTLGYPDQMLDEMLRVGREAIITFPNFGHWQSRLYLLWKGRMPVTPSMPKTWYETDNIHFCTFKDFEDLCADKNIQILDKMVIKSEGYADWLTKILPNVFGQVVLYRLTGHQ